MSDALIDAFSELETFDDGEKPWCDLVFDLTQVEVVGRKPWFGKDRRAVKAVARGATPRGEIGFAFETAPVGDWSANKSEGFSSAWGKVALRSIGEPTDRLLGEYETWWDMPTSGAPVISEIWCQAVLISEKPDAIIDRVANIKLFFQGAGSLAEDAEGDDQEPFDYGELYLNFGVQARHAQLREKDPDYRDAVAGFLSGRIPAGELSHG